MDKGITSIADLQQREEENLLNDYFEEDVIETIDEIYEENDIEVI